MKRRTCLHLFPGGEVGSLEGEVASWEEGAGSRHGDAGSLGADVASRGEDAGSRHGGAAFLEADVASREGGAEPGDCCPGDAADPARPLRRDAERNRQRILKAASEVFTEFGLEVSLDEVARHAGVGVGTVYRRFRTKEDLVAALFEDRVDAIATLAERATREPDPWTGLVHFMEQAAEMLADDLGLRQMLMFATYGQDHVAYARRRNQPLVQKLLGRAQAAGQVRADLRPTDIPFIIFVLTEATVLARQARPDIWRRYLALIIDGMRPVREGLTPLPVPALLPEEMEKSMRESAPRHR
jgi:AcrR family transcriptional regulator